MTVTKADLINELSKKYADLSADDWNKKCKSRGTHVKKDYQLDRLEDLLPEKINRTQDVLEETQIRPFLTAEQKLWYEQKIQEIKTTIAEKRALRKGATKAEKKKLVREQDKLLHQLDLLFDEYDRENRVNYFKNKVNNLKEKFICIDKEKEIRLQDLFPRSPIGTTYYLDFNGNTGTLTGTWTFTNASATVSANSDGAATTELATGNYIRVSNGTEWYKITGITDDNTITISPAFQHSTITDTVGDTQYNNYDGTATTTPFVHLNQYTNDTVRNPGDILKVRANQTHHYDGIDINFDLDGNANNLLSIKGCSSTDDPWTDSSDVKPIISFGDTAYNMNMAYDYYWKFERLELIESDDSGGVLKAQNCQKLYLTDCVIRDNDPSGYGLSITNTITKLDGCEFYNNLGSSIMQSSGILYVKNSTFNGGTVTTDYGIQSSGIIYAENSTFGVTTVHDVADIYLTNTSAVAYNKNCNFATSSEFKFATPTKGAYSEDHDQTKGDQKRITYNGTVTRDTGTVRSGGASSSAKLEPNSYIGLYYPLTISDDFAGDFKIWASASQKTVTIYLQTFGYSTLPAASELYIEASYLDEASGGHRALIDSTDTVSANATWTGFAVTLTPSQEGWVYVTLNLKKYEASSGAYIDIKPVIS